MKNHTKKNKKIKTNKKRMEMIKCNKLMLNNNKDNNNSKSKSKNNNREKRKTPTHYTSHTENNYTKCSPKFSPISQSNTTKHNTYYPT